MSGDGLFHIDSDNQMISMAATPYEAEEVLQRLLQEHPDLLAGGQMTPDEPRRWALVKREYGVPDSGESTARWSIDHLFVDQDAVPTLVEVKRSTDTRIRREVVGQMLDYAATGVRYWPTPELRASFEDTQRRAGLDPGRVITDLLDDPDVTVDEFFEEVANNLTAGRIRLVFVADLIPDELRRIVEFLNEQMKPADVLAVEVKQYRAPGHEGRVIVPALYGRTGIASAKRGMRPRREPDEIFTESEPATRDAVERFIALSEEQGLGFRYTNAGVQLRTPKGVTVAQVYAYDSIEVPLRPLRNHGYHELADALLDRLQAITSRSLTAAYPSVPTADAVKSWDAFQAVLVEASRARDEGSRGSPSR